MNAYSYFATGTVWSTGRVAAGQPRFRLPTSGSDCPPTAFRLRPHIQMPPVKRAGGEFGEQTHADPGQDVLAERTASRNMTVEEAIG